MKVELLAPAKDKITAIEAINCGCDAVYIGANSFGARKNASNNIEDIKEVINYAHKFWVKVYVTVNTILTDSELQEAVKLVNKLDSIGADGIIIQDLGLLNKLMSLNLNIPIHMSTQCDNYLPKKINFFNKIGVSRVVLARECSLEKIKQIKSENPDLELESFCHGALCVSFSGQCYLSQYIGGRSANRGECAQPCRKKYSVETTDGKVIAKDIYALCLKDFNASNKIDDMVHAGVHSFKIEGRLKDIGYVKNIVAYYSQKLENYQKTSSGKSFYEFEPNPKKSFNRGFTEYFLNNKRENCWNFNSPKSTGEFLGKIIEVKNNCIKIKTDKKINRQDGLFVNNNGFLVNKAENGYVYPNNKIDLKIGDKIYRNFDSEFEKSILRPTKRQIGINILFKDNLIKIIDQDGIELKYELLKTETATNKEKMKDNFVKQFFKTGESDFYVTDIKIASDVPFLQISVLNQIRRECFEKLMEKRIEFYNSNIKKVQKPLNYAKYYANEVDYRANIHNKSAVEFYEKCGAKVTEMSLEKTIPNKEVELMRCKHCIKYTLNMCKSPINLVLKDDYGNIYPLKFDCKNCEMSVLNNP